MSDFSYEPLYLEKNLILRQLRDHIALVALPAVLVNSGGSLEPKDIARETYRIADAMILECLQRNAIRTDAPTGAT